MTVYAQHYSTKKTPQTGPIPGSNQVANSAGGYVFALDDWRRLDRFLIIGSTGTYYTQAKPLTVENAEVVRKLLGVNWKRLIDRIVEISQSGRAPKNDPAIFALAICCAFGCQQAKDMALQSMPLVCRTGTHLFDFIRSVTQLRGWGRGLKRAVAEWYTKKTPKELAYQLCKYQQRNGWSHRDVLRLCKPSGVKEPLNTALRWAVGKAQFVSPYTQESGPGELAVIQAFEHAKRMDLAHEVPDSIHCENIARLIHDFDLPRECVPTRFLNSPVVWDALLQKMPLTALVRNLGKMSAIGLLSPLSDALAVVQQKLGDVEYIQKSRLHPMAVLLANKTYQAGHGDKGKLFWGVVPQVVDALEGAFYAAFENIEPTNKRHLLALDVSGSMGYSFVQGASLTAAEASAAMAMVTARSEPNYHVMAFAGRFKELPISRQDNLQSALKKTRSRTFGATDCSLPMTWALENRVQVDVFVVYTDSETYAGSAHPKQAMERYRNAMGIDTKLAVVGMTSTGFTINDPNDLNGLDLVGFDASTPAILSEWVR